MGKSLASDRTTCTSEAATMTRTVLGARSLLSAQTRIRPHIHESPLIHSSSLSTRVNGDVWLKLESRQPTGSFKVRGALNKLSQLGGPRNGVVTGSAGNHGLGLAFAADRLGVRPVTIFVPKTAPEVKIDRLRAFDIDLQFSGKTYDDAHHAALAYSEDHGARYIHAYDDEDIIAGQGTAGLEIMAQLPQADVVVVPVGGGGLIAGIAVAVKELSPSTRVVGVQAAASPSGRLSLKDGTPYDPYVHEKTIADGLAGGFGAKPFYLARTLIEDILLYDEEQIRRCVYRLLNDDRVLAEPSGAIAIAPLLEPDDGWRDKHIVCLISGSNLETSLLRDILVEFAKQ